MSACEKHFGSLRKAVETLGLDYDKLSMIKTVTKKWLIREIHSFVASGDPLSSLYTTRSALMRKSKRLYGSVSQAFRAAGYRYDELICLESFPLVPYSLDCFVPFTLELD